MGYASQPNPAFGYYGGAGRVRLGSVDRLPVPAGDRGNVRVRVHFPGAEVTAVSLKDVLHELAGRANALHLHDAIDALPDDEPEPAAEPEAPAEPEAKGKGK